MSDDKILSAARLAEMRERALLLHSEGAAWHAVEDRRALLAHIDALQAPCDRETGGRLVRKVWIAWAKEQPSPKASWLVEWDDLSEPDREVDRSIFEACYAAGRASLQAPAPNDGAREEREACARYLAENGDPPGALKLRLRAEAIDRARAAEGRQG